MTTAQQVIDAIRAIAPCSRSAWTPKAVNESASVIQQAITEAVDAAVALERGRYAPYLRHTSKCDLSAGHYKDGVTRVCDCGLESLVKEK